jgi:DNA-binding transcriptional ArsR family regulator
MPRRWIVSWERWDVTRAADGPLDDAVRAVGHPGRRAMLRLARDEERSASELADAAGLSPSAASPHLKVLRDAGLMHVRVDAKRRMYRADVERLQAVRHALDELWDVRLDSLRMKAESRPEPARDAEGETA